MKSKITISALLLSNKILKNGGRATLRAYQNKISIYSVMLQFLRAIEGPCLIDFMEIPPNLYQKLITDPETCMNSQEFANFIELAWQTAEKKNPWFAN